MTADDWNRAIGRTMRNGQAADAVTIEYEPAPCAGLSKVTSDRTPLPPGWEWGERCFVAGPCGAFAFVLVAPESNPGRIDTHNDKPAPPAIHNALVTEAARLGLPCHEKPMTAPEGYWFDVEDHGVFCRMRAEWTSGLNVCSYFRPEHPEVASNADAGRWAGHEAARQWAAYLLGEVAPPLRTETR